MVGQLDPLTELCRSRLRKAHDEMALAAAETGNPFLRLKRDDAGNPITRTSPEEPTGLPYWLEHP